MSVYELMVNQSIYIIYNNSLKVFCDLGEILKKAFLFEKNIWGDNFYNRTMPADPRRVL